MSTAINTTKNMPCNFSDQEEYELRRGPWTLEEDTLLIHYITSHGEGRWNLLAKCSGLKRTGKSCRLRWLNYLKPDIKRGNLTPQEQLLILELHSKWGNRWSKIAQHLPGRTDNEIKNYWRTRVQKQARQLKIDSNSKKFVEALRRFWMPRLLEKVEQSSSSSSFSSTSTMETQKSTISPFPQTKQALFAVSSPQPGKTENSLDEKSSPSLCTSDSMGIITPNQLPDISEHQTTPSAHAYENTAYNNSALPNDYYYVDTSGYDMMGFNHTDMSALGSSDISASECQMAGTNWMSDDLAGSFWNMDELWQFRK